MPKGKGKGGRGGGTKAERALRRALARELPVVALPAAIGELKALTTLNLNMCSSLAALPESIGELSVLKMLDLRECSRFTALPASLLWR